jgi:hypothetical protein
MDTLERWSVGLVVLALVAFAALAGRGTHAGAAPADAVDAPVAFQVSFRDEAFVALAGDTGGTGAVVRMNADCREILRWPTAGEPLDIAVEDPWVWVLESDPAAGAGQPRVVRYDTAGRILGSWTVDGTARRLDLDRGTAMYVLHRADGGERARVVRHSAEGNVQGGWTLGDDAVDLAVYGRGGTPEIYVVGRRADGGGGRVSHFNQDGQRIASVDFDLLPTAVARNFTSRVYVYGTVPGVPSARVADVNIATGVVTMWATGDNVPLDVTDQASTLGRTSGTPALAVLRRFRDDGTPIAECHPPAQPPGPTAEPGPRACPRGTPGVEVWRYPAAGKVSGPPAVDANGGLTFASLEGLMWSVDCTGAGRWMFDYIENAPDRMGYAQAFHGAPALDADGTIYVGDDIMVPNFFFAVRPDGTVKWVRRFHGVYSEIDTSPAVGADGRIYAGAHGWGAGVSRGCILAFDRDGNWLRPSANREDQYCDESSYTGPIKSSPVVLADQSAVFAVPRYEEWVLPTTTPPTGTPPTPTPSRTPLPTETRVPTRTPVPPTPTRDVIGTATAIVPTLTALARTASPTPTPQGSLVFIPFAQRPSRAVTTNDTVAAAPAQPLPPPWVTVPVPARLHQVHAAGTPDTVVDLDDLDAPSSPAADGQTVWLTAQNPGGAWLLAYAFDPGAAPRRVLAHPLRAVAAGSPVLGRKDAGTGRTEVYVMGTDGTVVALEVSVAGTGGVTERWSRFVATPAGGAPALGDDGLVYVAAGSVVQALTRGSGELRWSVDVGEEVSTSLQLASGGTLYVGTMLGTVVAIGTGAGGPDPEAVWPLYRHDPRNAGAAGR